MVVAIVDVALECPKFVFGSLADPAATEVSGKRLCKIGATYDTAERELGETKIS